MTASIVPNSTKVAAWLPHIVIAFESIVLHLNGYILRLNTHSLICAMYGSVPVNVERLIWFYVACQWWMVDDH